MPSISLDNKQALINIYKTLKKIKNYRITNNLFQLGLFFYNCSRSELDNILKEQKIVPNKALIPFNYNIESSSVATDDVYTFGIFEKQINKLKKIKMDNIPLSYTSILFQKYDKDYGSDSEIYDERISRNGILQIGSFNEMRYKDLLDDWKGVVYGGFWDWYYEYGDIRIVDDKSFNEKHWLFDINKNGGWDIENLLFLIKGHLDRINLSKS